LVVLIAALFGVGFYASGRKAMRELTSGDADTGVAYLLLSVAGILSLLAGSVIVISGLIEKAYGY
jgi:hypothetical protein